MPEPCVVLLDVDGTLVDSNYLHTIAWHRALRRSGHTVPMTVVHRLIGMGADQLLGRLLGQEDDHEHVEARWAEEFERLRPEVTATPGARDLVHTLHERGATACGVPCVTVTTGGISRPELEAAGAAAVYESPDELLQHLDVSPLAVLLGGGAATS